MLPRKILKSQLPSYRKVSSFKLLGIILASGAEALTIQHKTCCIFAVVSLAATYFLLGKGWYQTNLLFSTTHSVQLEMSAATQRELNQLGC